VPNVNPLGYGAVAVTRLERPRLIESAKLQHEHAKGDFGVRVSLYGEAHQLSAGVQRSLVTGDELALPADTGALIGAQGTVWGPSHLYAHLWVRQAAGLAVYDELEAPRTFANDRTTKGARSTRVAASAGWDSSVVGLLAGAYFDVVRDAGVSSSTAQKFDEGAVSLRAQWYAMKYAGLAVEANLQRRVYGLVEAQSGVLRGGTVGQFAVMPYFSPLGHGLFQRPQLRLIYALSLRDAGAQSFYGIDDVFSKRGLEHYVGLSIEWWFNATTYPVR
jgi:maltoporin